MLPHKSIRAHTSTRRPCGTAKSEIALFLTMTSQIIAFAVYATECFTEIWRHMPTGFYNSIMLTKSASKAPVESRELQRATMTSANKQYAPAACELPGGVCCGNGRRWRSGISPCRDVATWRLPTCRQSDDEHTRIHQTRVTLALCVLWQIHVHTGALPQTNISLNSHEKQQ